jgi:hypothetical protein
MRVQYPKRAAMPVLTKRHPATDTGTHMSNLNHEESTRYAKAIYYKLEMFIAEHKAHAEMDKGKLFRHSRAIAKAFEEFKEDIDIQAWMESTQKIESESE